MGEPNGQYLFGRYTREECGLPPKGTDFARERLPGRAVVLLLLGAALAAWLGGSAMARYRQTWLALLPAQVATTPENAEALLARGKIYAAALADNDLARRNLANAVALTAEISPRRLGFYANANTLYGDVDRAKLPNAAERFATELAASNALAETGRNREALAALQNAAAALADLPEQDQQPYRLLLVNSQAYLLATIPAEEGGNAEAALNLARLMISSRDALPGGGFASGSAALMDTLASAYHASGRAERAADAQTMALGLADSAGLDIYLRHYDQFVRSTTPGEARQVQRKNDVQ